MDKLLFKLTKQYKQVVKALAYQYGYVVRSKEYPKAEHTCFTYASALEWMECYQGSYIVKNYTMVASNQLASN